MIPANSVSPAKGWSWIVQGAALFGRQPTAWLAMSLIYLVVAVVLGMIPFVGWLVLVLLSPTLLLGALVFAKEVHRQAEAPPAVEPVAPVPLVDRFRQTFRWAINRLFAGFGREDQFLPLMVISTMLLAGVVVIRILAQLLRVGGTAIPSMFSGVGASLWLPALVGLIVVLGLYTLLLMAFVYAVPLVAFRGSHPLPAIESAFSAASMNWKAFAIFAGVFSFAGEMARLLFLFLSFPFDYFAFLALGIVLLPIMAGSLYASYLDQFTRRDTPAA